MHNSETSNQLQKRKSSPSQRTVLIPARSDSVGQEAALPKHSRRLKPETLAALSRIKSEPQKEKVILKADNFVLAVCQVMNGGVQKESSDKVLQLRLCHLTDTLPACDVVTWSRMKRNSGILLRDLVLVKWSIFPSSDPPLPPPAQLLHRRSYFLHQLRSHALREAEEPVCCSSCLIVGQVLL